MKARAWWGGALLGLLCSHPCAARADEKPPAVVTLLERVAASKAELAKLKPSATQSKEQVSAAFRFVKYGVTAGVSAALYVPGSPAHSLTGVAGGALPFVGFFPGYWSGSGARNTFCAVEWSAPQAEAEKAGESQKTEEDKETKTVDAAEKKVDEAKTAVDKAATVESLKSQLDPNQADAVVDGAKREAADKVAAAETAVDKAKEKVDDLSKYDVERLDEEASGQRALRKDRQKKLDARIDEWSKKNPSTSAMSFSQLVQLARKYYNEAQALQDEYDECVAAAEAGKREKSSCAKRVLEVAGAPPSPPPSTPSCAAYVAAGSGMGAEVGLAACDYLHARTEELDAQEDYKRGKDAYRGAKTYCGAHKVGFFFGYPAMFNASTYVESMSSPNQAKRDITPVMAHGVVVAPNALVALTAGSWVGMVDVSSTETAVVWGFTAGAALTADVFSLIR